MSALQNLRISTRLLIAYALFLLPVAALFYSVYSSNHALVAFTRKEIRGTFYVEALQHVMDAVARNSDPATLTRAADQVEAAERQYGGETGTASSTASAVGLLRMADPSVRDSALSALQTLIARAADGSNLTLDSDLDSAYVMDALTVKVPDIVARLSALVALSSAYSGRAELSPAEQAAFLAQEGGVIPALDGLGTSLDAAFRGNPSGATRSALAARLTAAQDAVSTAVAELHLIALGNSGGDRTDAVRLGTPALAAMSDLAQAGEIELRHLLKMRVAMFHRILVRDMLAALVFFAVAVAFLVAAIQRGVVSPVIVTANLMERLAAGDTAVGVPGQERRDEIGAMARAIEVFRQTAVEVAQMRTAELRDAHRVARIGTWRRDLVNGALAISDELYYLFGVEPRGLDRTRADFMALIHPDDRAATELALERAIAGEEQVEQEWRVLRPDGSIAWFWGEANLERDASGRAVAVRGVCQDITERRAVHERIYKLAHHDALTGLANRALLSNRLTDAIASAQRTHGSLAVLCLDLDGFKAVNDLHGHSAGDRLLQEVGARLGRNAREIDTVARLGGDEFVVLQAGSAQPEAARALAERLVAALSEPYDLGTGRGQAVVTTSIGIALFPEDGSDPETLLHNADTALYRAKGAGKNGSAFFRPEMDQELRERRALERDLQQAAARGEFALAWQPIARGSSAEVSGFEVLLRWHHPERGLVPPDVFIPISEACGAVIALGAWVLREACQEAARWSVPLRVAVNVSPLQVQQGEAFAELVEDVLGTTGLAPSRLVLEVTEGILIRETGRVLTALHRLKALGIQVALDDFGTGYSSLATLRAFPFDKLKIDRSFVSGMTAGAASQDAAIVWAVLGLARGLRLPVVAEGVETKAQLEMLCAAGCEELQGWLIGRPAPIASFVHLTGSPCEAAA